MLGRVLGMSKKVVTPPFAGPSRVVEILLIGQARFAKVDLVIDHTRQQVKPDRIHRFIHADVPRGIHVPDPRPVDQHGGPRAAFRQDHGGILDQCLHGDGTAFDIALSTGIQPGSPRFQRTGQRGACGHYMLHRPTREVGDPEAEHRPWARRLPHGFPLVRIDFRGIRKVGSMNEQRETAATADSGAEPAKQVVRTSLQAVLAQVRRDCMANSKRYLDETTVPYGGE